MPEEVNRVVTDSVVDLLELWDGRTAERMVSAVLERLRV
jgi:hypothetical protein